MSEPEQSGALIEGERSIELLNGQTITLRPFSLGSIGLFKRMGLTMFSGGKDEQDIEAEQNEEFMDGIQEPAEQDLDDGMLWELAAFFWVQSQPVAEVLTHVRNDTWTEQVEEFSLEIPMASMATLMAEVNRISQLTEEVAVDVVSKKDDDKEESGAPPN